MQKIIYKFYGINTKSEISMPRISWADNYLFRFTQPDKLNDPFEVHPRLLFNQYSNEDYQVAYDMALKSNFFQDVQDITKERLEKLFLDPFPSKRIGDIRPWPQYIEEYNKTFNSFEEFDRYEAELLLKNFLYNVNHIRGIFSLTKTKRNLLMWSHYASEHKGIALGFDSNHPFFRNNLYEVLYTKERLSISAVKGWIRINGYTQDEFPNNDITTFLRKPTCWSYEKELRMVKFLSESDNESNGIYLFRIPPNAIKQLILGARMNKVVKEKLISKIQNNNKLNHIKIYQASLNENKYGLKFSEIKNC